MKASFSPIQLSAFIVSFENLSLENFDEQLRLFVNENKQIREYPIFLSFGLKGKQQLSELSILVDNLKDLGLYVAGIISRDKVVRNFAEFLSVPSFRSVEAVSSLVNHHQIEKPQGLPSAQSNHQPKAKTSTLNTATDLNQAHLASHSSAEYQSASPDSTNLRQQSDALRSVDTAKVQQGLPSEAKQRKLDQAYQRQAQTKYRPVNDVSGNDQTSSMAEKIRFEQQQHQALRSRFEKPQSVSHQQANSLNQLSAREILDANHAPQVPQVPVMPKTTNASVLKQAPQSAANIAEEAASQVAIDGDNRPSESLTEPKRQPLVVTEKLVWGKRLKHAGDVILMKGCEKGSVVQASGSIHVHEKAEGTLLAGSSGNNKARIYATDMQAEAIAISGLYARFQQYQAILNRGCLMIVKNTQEDKLDFSRIDQLPIISDASAPRSSQQSTHPTKPEPLFASSTGSNTTQPVSGQRVKQPTKRIFRQPLSSSVSTPKAAAKSSHSKPSANQSKITPPLSQL